MSTLGQNQPTGETEFKNTKLYMWIDPVIMNHEKGKGKVYFYCVLKGNLTELENDELERELEGKILQSVMDFADIDQNYNFGIKSATLTNEPAGTIEWEDSPKEKKQKAAVEDVLAGTKKLNITDKNITVADGGMLKIKHKETGLKDTLDFAKIWNSLEQNVIGKIKEGDNVKLTDKDGNILFELMDGSYLSMAGSDLNVYDQKKLKEDGGYFGKMAALKGGLYIREDGSLDIGDVDRTFYLSINMNNVVKASLAAKGSLMDVMTKSLMEGDKKLLEGKPTKRKKQNKKKGNK